MRGASVQCVDVGAGGGRRPALGGGRRSDSAPSNVAGKGVLLWRVLWREGCVCGAEDQRRGRDGTCAGGDKYCLTWLDVCSVLNDGEAEHARERRGRHLWCGLGYLGHKPFLQHRVFVVQGPGAADGVARADGRDTGSRGCNDSTPFRPDGEVCLALVGRASAAQFRAVIAGNLASLQLAGSYWHCLSLHFEARVKE